MMSITYFQMGFRKKNKYMCSINITCVNIGEKANTANVINAGGYMAIQRSFSLFRKKFQSKRLGEQKSFTDSYLS